MLEAGEQTEATLKVTKVRVFPWASTISSFPWKGSVISLVLAGVSPVPVQAANDAELRQLRQQMKELQQRYEAQGQALKALEARVQQITAAVPVPPAPRAGKRGKVVAAAPTGAAAAGIPPGAPAAGAPGAPPTAAAPPAGTRAPAVPPGTAPPAPAQPVPAGGPGGVPEGQSIDQKQMAAAPGAATPGKPVVKRPPLTEAQQAVLRQANVLFNRRLTLEAGFSWFHSSRANLNLSGFLALDAIFLGRIGVNQVKSDTLRLDLSTRYAFMDRMQLDLNVPFLYRSTTYQAGGVGSASNKFSEADVTMDPELADVNAGFYFQAFRETSNWPDTVFNVRLKAPTGSHPYNIATITPDPDNKSLIVPEKLSSGNGVWTPSFGISLVKTFDPAVLFANFSYFYNIEETFGNLAVRLGNSYSIGLGTSFAINERMSLTFGFSDLISDTTQTRVKGQDWVTIVGSDSNAAVFNFGLTFAFTDRSSILTNVGIGLTPDAPDVQFSLRTPYTF